MSKTKEQISMEELQSQMEKVKEEKRVRFNEEYTALCQKHGFQIMPQLVLNVVPLQQS